MGIGSVRVVVPDDVCVASNVRVGAGYARVLDRDSGGLDVDWRQSPGENGGVKRLVIDGDVGIGELQVVNNRSAFGRLATNGPASTSSSTTACGTDSLGTDNALDANAALQEVA